MDYYNEIKQKLLRNKIYNKIKEYSSEKYKVITYFEIGKLLDDAGKAYGKNIIKQYSEKLRVEVGNKYNERTLYRMRKFYQVFSNEKLTPLVSKLSWSHYLQLLPIKNVDEIIYYINTASKNCLSKRELQEKIISNEYLRLKESAKLKLIKQEKLDIVDLIPNPIIIKNGPVDPVSEKLSEYALKQLILNDLDDFLSQIGFGFAYVGNEFRIDIDDFYNYIDLLFFNYKYNCFVVVELKATELKKEHIGQIQVYMNYINKNLKQPEQENTIGIIICKKDNKYVIEYCSDERIIAREYRVGRR